MSTAGGPKLAGIGRSGDSDIVLCMDARDAGSYPGEPTTNECTFTLSDSGTDGSGQGSVGTRTLITNNHVRIVDVASNTRQTFLIEGLTASTTYTISTLYKKLEGTPTFRYQIQDHSGSTYLRVIKFTNTAEIGIEDKDGWQLGSWTFVLGSDANAVRIWFQDGADYTTYTHSFELKNPQLEAKAYATPFVREGNGGTGTHNARPASINLSLNDGSYEDKSPNKLALTNTSTTMPGFGGKFGGAAYYFNASSSLKYTIPSGSSALFGTGNFTIDFWHYMPAGTSLKNYATWFSTYDQNNSGIIIAEYGTSGTYGVWNHGTWLNTGVTLLTDQWAHVAIVRRGTGTNECTYYLNGTSILSFTLNFSFATAVIGSFLLGSLYTASHDYALEGYMSDVRVCSGTALWTSAFTPPTRRNLNGPLVDLSGSNNGGNFNTDDMTDVSTYRDGQVIEPVASAVWDFDGTDDIIDLGNINYNGLPGLTVATWVYSSGFGANDTFLSSWGDNSSSNYAWLLFASQWVGSKIDWLISSNGTSYTRCAGTLGLTNNLWYHIVGTWNSSGAMVLYINGALDGTATGPTSIMNNDFNTFIGCDSDGGSESKVRFFGGQMGNATIWKTTLTAQQVKQNFNSQRSRFQV